MARTIHCIKLNKEAEGLDFPPYPGELGKKIYESVSKEAWAAWLKHQTMLVNENRLNLADARARKYLATQMEKHFFGDGADAAMGYVPPTEKARRSSLSGLGCSLYRMYSSATRPDIELVCHGCKGADAVNSF